LQGKVMKDCVHALFPHRFSPPHINLLTPSKGSIK